MAKTENNIIKVTKDNAPIGWILFAAYIGAVIYFFGLDPTFWGFILALIKAIFWPAFLVYEALAALGVN